MIARTANTAAAVTRGGWKPGKKGRGAGKEREREEKAVVRFAAAPPARMIVI